MRTALILVAGAVLAGMGWVRLAPSDPARWDVPLATAPAGLTDRQVLPVPGGAWLRLRLPLHPAEALARLDAVALATPRTRRLADYPSAGRITWVTRSLIFGFPDYTTAEARAGAGGTAITLHARQRFGRGDMGVNAARLSDWQARIGG